MRPAYASRRPARRSSRCSRRRPPPPRPPPARPPPSHPPVAFSFDDCARSRLLELPYIILVIGVLQRKCAGCIRKTDVMASPPRGSAYRRAARRVDVRARCAVVLGQPGLAVAPRQRERGRALHLSRSRRGQLSLPRLDRDRFRALVTLNRLRQPDSCVVLQPRPRLSAGRTKARYMKRAAGSSALAAGSPA